MKYFVTTSAVFGEMNLAGRLLAKGLQISGLDNHRYKMLRGTSMESWWKAAPFQ